MKVIIVSKLGPSFSMTLFYMTRGVLFHKAQKQPGSLNDSQSLTEIRVICTVAGEWKAAVPATCSYPISLEPVTEFSNSGFKMNSNVVKVHEHQDSTVYC
jgi:hypothetical protein